MARGTIHPRKFIVPPPKDYSVLVEADLQILQGLVSINEYEAFVAGISKLPPVIQWLHVGSMINSFKERTHNGY